MSNKRDGRTIVIKGSDQRRFCTMPVYETFSRRRDQAAKAASGEPEIYVYDRMPDSLVNQIVMIWDELLGGYGSIKIGQTVYEPSDVIARVEQMFMREHGLLSIYKLAAYEDMPAPLVRVSHFFRNTKNNDYRLDLIDLVFSIVSRSDLRTAAHYIDELNQRFKLAGVGYQFVEGKLIRIDSTVAHEEMVKPALVLLGRKGFEKADEQYRAAHDHYRRDEHPQAITEAGKAFDRH